MEVLTPTEQQEEKARKADLAAAISRLDDVELKLFAGQAGVEVDKYPERKDLIAALELQAEANAAAGRQKIRDMDAEQGRAVAEENDRRPATARIIRALNAEFCRELPQAAHSGGSFEPEDDHPRFGGDYEVPNGKYRVVGSEWMFLIHKKKLQAVARATEANKWGGKHVIAVE